MSSSIRDTSLNFIAEQTEIEGKLRVQHTARIHGRIRGELIGLPGSNIILMEGSVVEGSIHAEELIVSGFVQGEIRARKRVVVAASGRVIGNIQAPSIRIEFGAHLEGRCSMEGETLTADPSPARGPLGSPAPAGA